MTLEPDASAAKASAVPMIKFPARNVILAIPSQASVMLYAANVKLGMQLLSRVTTPAISAPWAAMLKGRAHHFAQSALVSLLGPQQTILAQTALKAVSAIRVILTFRVHTIQKRVNAPAVGASSVTPRPSLCTLRLRILEPACAPVILTKLRRAMQARLLARNVQMA
jgi:hypothetical protein